MEVTNISKKILINHELYKEIGSCEYYVNQINKLYTSEFVIDKYEILANLNLLLKNNRDIKSYESISSILYAFKIIDDKQLTAKEIINEEFNFLDVFIESKKDKIKTFIKKWWDNKEDGFKYILNLNDFKESDEPMYIDIRFQSIIGLYGGLDINDDGYYIQLCDDDQENAHLYVDFDDINQCYILENKYDELINDLEVVFS